MAHSITLGEEHISMSNRHLENIFSFTTEVAALSELSEVEAELFAAFTQRRESGQYWAGCSLDLLEDFPSESERKLWARLLLDTAQAIFEREIGLQDNAAWQTLTIHLLHSLGHMFVESVNKKGQPRWWPETRQQRERQRFMDSLKN